MGKKSGPKAPDPVQTAQAQSQMNKEAILASAIANRTNQAGPTGSVSWTDAQGNAIDPNAKYTPEQLAGWTQTTALGESEQRLKDTLDTARQGAAGGLPGGALDLSGLPNVSAFKPQGQFKDLTAIDPSQAPGRQTFTGLSGDVPAGVSLEGLRDLDQDYSADAAHVEDATFQRLKNILDPQYDERRRKQENRLAVMGHAPGGEGFGYEQDRLGRLENEGYGNAALDAVRAGRAEQSRLYGIDSDVYSKQLAGRTAEHGTGLQSRGQRLTEALMGVDSANAARDAQLREQQQVFDASRADANKAMQERQQRTSEGFGRIATQENAQERALRDTMLERNTPLNELTALIAGGGVQGPTPLTPAQYQQAPPDLIGLTNNEYANKSANQQAKKGGLTGLAGTLGGAALGNPRLFG